MAMNRPIAIINARIDTPQGECESGVVLVDEGRIIALGRDYTVELPARALLLDAERGRVSASYAGAPVLRPGAAADLICHTRFGEIAWVMAAGVIVQPANAAAPARGVTWAQRWEDALQRTSAYLQQQPQNRHLQATYHIAGYRQKGIDLIWRFLGDDGRVRSLSIRVTPALDERPQRVVVLDDASARKLGEPALADVRAHWWFYFHASDNVIYCIPTTGLRRWLKAGTAQTPLVPLSPAGVHFSLSGRIIPIGRLQRHIPRIRVISLLDI